MQTLPRQRMCNCEATLHPRKDRASREKKAEKRFGPQEGVQARTRTVRFWTDSLSRAAPNSKACGLISLVLATMLSSAASGPGPGIHIRLHFSARHCRRELPRFVARAPVQ